MAKYSQTDGGLRVQHFDTLEELEEHNRNTPKEVSFLGCFLLSVTSALLIYFLFYKFGFSDAAKWIKAAAILAVATPLGVIGFKYGETILGFIYLAVFVMVGIGVLSFIWSLL